jgi:hypothetical protein
MILSNQEEMELWRKNPATAEFFRFLTDRRSDLMQRWAEGATLGPEEQAQAVTLSFLLDLKADDVAGYYQIGAGNDDPATA